MAITITHSNPFPPPRVAFEKFLYNYALAEWNHEKSSDYRRVKILRNPESIAVVHMLSSMAKGELDEVLSILPKRSREYLQKADVNFLPCDQKRIIDAFASKLIQSCMPYFSGNEMVSKIWDEHNSLRKSFRSDAKKIRMSIIHFLNDRLKGWTGFKFLKPEPNMVSFHRCEGNMNIVVNWDMRPWELFCGLYVNTINFDVLVDNHSFLGSLGISSSPAWYIDEQSAIEVASVFEKHMLNVANLLIMNATSQPWHAGCQ